MAFTLKNVFLLYGFAMCLFLKGTSAKSGGFVQTSVFSTNGGSASGVAESSFVDSDGIRKGECSFTDSSGTYIRVKYEEDKDGNFIKGDIKNGDSTGSAKEALSKCRQAIRDIKVDLSEAEDELESNMADFEKSFKQQMDIFNRQQEDLLEQMSEFSSKMWSQRIGLRNQFAQFHRNFMRHNPFFNFSAFF